LVQAILAGLAVAAVISLMQWAGLFTSIRLAVTNYLYNPRGDPGDDIVIVAIDERSQRALGDWPWTFDPYVQLMERLGGAGAVGLDVLLPDPGPEGNPAADELQEAVRRAGNVILPLAGPLHPPVEPSGELYSVGMDEMLRPFPALVEAASGAGSVEVVLDSDATLRRVPLLVEVRAGDGEGQRSGTAGAWEALALQILRVRLRLGPAPASLVGDRVVIGDETEIVYEVRTDANGGMLVNFVGRPGTFPAYSFVDVIEDRVDPAAFEDRIVLVGMMNALVEMDLHRTPVAARRMSGVEFQANVIHTLLNHRPLVPQSQAGTIVTIVALALASALVLSQFGALLGAVFTLLLTVGYFVFTSLQFNAGRLPDVLFPYAAILVTYAAVMATRFARERVERRQVSDVFGRFVSPEVRDAIVNVALQDPDLVQPGGRQMEISVLFADIRGFTAMSEKLPPADVVEVLNQYLDSMEAEVFKQRGTLDKYTGDGMMVIFGAPLEQPDHAERAVRAALGMQRAAAGVSRRLADVQREMAYGIGIATGPAVVGHIGSRRRLDYTAIGGTVNLASRLEGVAPPATILVNRATYEAVRDLAHVEELEPVTLKGISGPVPVYKVVGLRE
jgi:adenylate cyclase